MTSLYRRSRYRAYLIRTSQVGGPLTVPIDEAREVLIHRVGQGFSQHAFGALAGVSQRVIWSIQNGRQERSQREIVAAILNATPQTLIAATLPASRVPAVGARRRLQALACIGWSYRALDHELQSARTATNLMTPSLHNATVTRALHDRVSQVYDRLWATPSTAERSRRTMKYADRNGYAPPMAWDDDTIDDPDAVPDRSTDTVWARNQAVPEEWFESYRDARELSGSADRTCARLGISMVAAEKRWYRRYPGSAEQIELTRDISVGREKRSA